MTNSEPKTQNSKLLVMRDITKSFPGVRALDGVTFDLEPGEIHALVGENGAGKSTLIRIVTGAVAADQGTLSISGDPVDLASLTPAVARALGIAVIYQQPALFPDLSVPRTSRWPSSHAVPGARSTGADAARAPVPY